MIHARDVLNEIKWRNNLALSETTIFYRNHKQPHLMTLQGTQIKSWDKSFIYTSKETSIPFHRVEKILNKGQVMYIKNKGEKETK